MPITLPMGCIACTVRLPFPFFCSLLDLETPIWHLDLKSPNVLICSLDSTREACAKISDFGSARLWNEEVNYLSEVDNPVWKAPEILSGELTGNDAISLILLICRLPCWRLFIRSHLMGTHVTETSLRSFVLLLWNRWRSEKWPPHADSWLLQRFYCFPDPKLLGVYLSVSFVDFQEHKVERRPFMDKVIERLNTDLSSFLSLEDNPEYSKYNEQWIRG